jgi:hypothetical protein
VDVRQSGVHVFLNVSFASPRNLIGLYAYILHIHIDCYGCKPTLQDTTLHIIRINLSLYFIEYSP